MGHRPGRRVGAGRDIRRGVGLPVALVTLGMLVLVLAVVWLSGAGAYAVWWLTNTTPPTIALSVPTDAVRGTISIGAQVAPAERARPVEVTVDGRPLTADRQVPIDTTSPG